MKTNPYEVLGLPPSASEEEIVRRAAQLRQTANEDEMTAVRQAVQALTGRPEERALFALLTPSGPVHEWPTLDRLEAAFRRPPPSAASGPTAAPPLDLAEVAGLMRPLLVRELEDAPLELGTPTIAESPEEILRQTVEGVWQMLPAEPLG